MELLIVVVVIAILAAITIVAYNGIQNRAYDSAVQSDLKNMATQIELYKVDHNGQIPRGSSELSGLGIKMSKSSHGILWNSGGIDYELLYCSPASGGYTIISRSKSGNLYRAGTSGTGQYTFPSSSTATPTVCSEAGVPIPDTSGTSRYLLYSDGWVSWVGGS